MKDLAISKSSLKILSVLLSTSQEHNLHTLAAATKLSVMGVSKIIKKLAQQKLITITPFGRSHLIRLRKSADTVLMLSLAEQYKRIMFTEKHKSLGPFIEFLRENLKAEFSFIFGSYASGEESSHSDLDILIVSSQEKEALKILKTAVAILTVEISPVIIGIDEFVRRVQQKHRLYQEIMEGKRIIISGEYEFWKRAVRM